MNGTSTAFGHTSSLGGVPVHGSMRAAVIPQRKQFAPEPDMALISELKKVGASLSKACSFMNGQKELMSEQIMFLEDSVVKNKELVEGLRKRIRQHSYSSESEVDTTRTNAINEITPSTVIDFLQNKPMVLEAFRNRDFRTFCDVCSALDESTQRLFLNYSNKQLERMSLCFTLCSTFTDSVRDPSFLEKLADCAKQLFNSTVCYLVVRNL